VEVTYYSGDYPIYVQSPGPSGTYVHFYANDIHLAKRATQRYEYYHQDHLGSTRIVTNWKGDQLFSTDYLPFGQPFDTSGPKDEEFLFINSKTTDFSGLIHFGSRYYDPTIGRFISPDSVLGALSVPSSMNRNIYCFNDPVNRVDADGRWSFFKSVCNLVESVVDAAVDLVGDVVEVAVDLVIEVAEMIETIATVVIDAASKFVENVKEACSAIAYAVITVGKAIQYAWDNLDPGWKQWIITGLSIAASIAMPGIGGVIVSCILDGTFIDMFTAITTGDWAMLALTLSGVALAGFGGKAALKAFKSAAGNIKIGGNIAKKLSKVRLKGSTFDKADFNVSKRAAKSFRQSTDLMENPGVGKRGAFENARTYLFGNMNFYERCGSAGTEESIRTTFNRIEDNWFSEKNLEDISSLII